MMTSRLYIMLFLKRSHVIVTNEQVYELLVGFIRVKALQEYKCHIKNVKIPICFKCSRKKKYKKRIS
jgi:hypothetical protein